jgi:hypothetical protein
VTVAEPRLGIGRLHQDVVGSQPPHALAARETPFREDQPLHVVFLGDEGRRFLLEALDVLAQAVFEPRGGRLLRKGSGLSNQQQARGGREEFRCQGS